MQTDRDSLQMMQILSFSPQDLEYNRHGQLSPAQRDMLKARKEAAIESGQRATRGTPFVFLYFVIVLAIIAVAFIATGAYQSVQASLGSLTLPVLGGVVLIILLIVATVPRSYRRSVARYQQMAGAMPVAYSVLYVDGEMKLKTRQVSLGGSVESNAVYITNYYAEVGPKEFQITEQRYHALKQAVGRSERYRVYFADTNRSGGLILSMERI